MSPSPAGASPQRAAPLDRALTALTHDRDLRLVLAGRLLSSARATEVNQGGASSMRTLTLAALGEAAALMGRREQYAALRSAALACIQDEYSTGVIIDFNQIFSALERLAFAAATENSRTAWNETVQKLERLRQRAPYDLSETSYAFTALLDRSCFREAQVFFDRVLSPRGQCVALERELHALPPEQSERRETWLRACAESALKSAQEPPKSLEVIDVLLKARGGDDSQLRACLERFNSPLLSGGAIGAASRQGEYERALTMAAGQDSSEVEEAVVRGFLVTARGAGAEVFFKLVERISDYSLRGRYLADRAVRFTDGAALLARAVGDLPRGEQAAAFITGACPLLRDCRDKTKRLLLLRALEDAAAALPDNEKGIAASALYAGELAGAGARKEAEKLAQRIPAGDSATLRLVQLELASVAWSQGDISAAERYLDLSLGNARKFVDLLMRDADASFVAMPLPGAGPDRVSTADARYCNLAGEFGRVLREIAVWNNRAYFEQVWGNFAGEISRISGSGARLFLLDFEALAAAALFRNEKYPA